MNNNTSKWWPIIQRYFKYIDNNYLVEILCDYYEWSSTLEFYGKDMSNHHTLIKSKIDEINHRKEIVGTYFNSITCKIQYKTVSGEYITDGYPEYKISTSDLIHVFGQDFMKYKFPDTMKDFNINKILE